MDYRTRIYERYFSNIQGQAGQVDLAVIDRFGKSYDAYLRGWLPADKNAAILDIGCGYGRLLRFFSKRGYTNVTGLDISLEQVSLARKIHSNVIQGNALEFLSVHPYEFDIIVALDLVEHFHKDEVICFIDSCYQALRSGGRLIIQTPNADSPWGLAVRYGDFTHETCFSPHNLRSLMCMCGFTKFEAREQGPCYLNGVFSFVRWTLWKFLRFWLLTYNLIETGSAGSNIFSRVFIASGVKQ
jgi:cyclopropane fatty-acyl-phospholipid synthase-like methyltransferase